MTHLPPTLDRPKFLEALGAFLNITMPACAQVTYRLVGTGAALLHGVTLPTGDIDILVRERKDVDAFGAALSSLTCLESPAWLPHARQYYGNWEVRGVQVGISTVEVPSDADTVETVGRGQWEHYVLLPCGRHSVPTVGLELRLITELYRNRPDRYRPLIQFMQVNGCDQDFVRRGIAGAGVPEAVRNKTLERLKMAPFRAVARLGRYLA